MKIMIIEDETLISLLLEDMVETLGHEVIGPFSCVEDSMVSISACDMAILDVNLGGGETTFCVADELVGLNKPFVFSTGNDDLDPKYAGALKLQKPFNIETLGEVLSLIA
jgi:DNA-binding response OmpR family regulator